MRRFNLTVFTWFLAFFGRPRRAFVLRGLPAVVCAACFGLPGVGHAQATFIGLGTLPGCYDSIAYGVSADGWMVVGRSEPAGAFRWTTATGMLGLGHLPGSSSSEADAVSADGSVAVGYDRGIDGDTVVRWTLGNGISSLGFAGEARDVSADGSVVVGERYSDTTEAFRWTSDAGAMGLGFLPGGIYSYALGVSADGSTIVGGASTAERADDAFRWTSGAGMVSLVTLPGVWDSEAFAASADGSVIVGYATDQEAGTQAFRWTASEGMVLLGTPIGVIGETIAYAVSADGSVIVGESSDYSARVDDAFIWDPVHGMRLLKDVLVEDYGLDLTGWELQWARGISGDGRTIVGNGVNPSGQVEAWIALLSPLGPRPQCSDGIDNDGDGFIDYPNDPGCASPTSPTESPACQDGIDNDGDGGIDFDGGASTNHGLALGPRDVNCVGQPSRDYESLTPTCGLGAELAIVVPLLMALRRRRRLSGGR